MTRRMILMLALATAVLLGVSEPVPAQQPTSAAQGARSETVLRPGDVLDIRVWPSAELSGEFSIEDTGLIHLPLLGAVRAVGVPIDQLREELRRGYAETMRNPVVTVTPMFRVTITGEVQRPGIQVVTPNSTLFDVIGMAGGFRATADTENLRVVRPGQVVDYDALRAMETGEGMDVIRLRSGDHIIVPGLRPSRLTVRNAFEAVRTISTLILLWDRVFR
jgi:polysaccharide biosynthesis/export protein